jgi:hypothetical protein
VDVVEREVGTVAGEKADREVQAVRGDGGVQRRTTGPRHPAEVIERDVADRDEVGRGHYIIVRPPDTLSVCPVM